MKFQSEYETYLEHYGVKGMRWGVRRYQNEDGTLTELGKERYYSKNESKRLKKAIDKLRINPYSSTPVEEIGKIPKTFGANKYKEEYAELNDARNFIKKQSSILSKQVDDFVKYEESDDFRSDLRNAIIKEYKKNPNCVKDSYLYDPSAQKAINAEFYIWDKGCQVLENSKQFKKAFSSATIISNNVNNIIENIYDTNINDLLNSNSENHKYFQKISNVLDSRDRLDLWTINPNKFGYVMETMLSKEDSQNLIKDVEKMIS